MMIGRQSDHRDVTCGESAPISELSPSRYSKSVAGATLSSRELILPAMEISARHVGRHPPNIERVEWSAHP